jgi:formylmethanofuran dehydrogenase subunit E
MQEEIELEIDSLDEPEDEQMFAIRCLPVDGTKPVGKIRISSLKCSKCMTAALSNDGDLT